MNSSGVMSVTNSRSNAPKSRSVVIDVTANALTSTRLSTNSGSTVTGSVVGDEVESDDRRALMCSQRRGNKEGDVHQSHNDYFPSICPRADFTPQDRIIPHAAQFSGGRVNRSPGRRRRRFGSRCGGGAELVTFIGAEANFL